MNSKNDRERPLRILHVEDSPRDAEIIRERLIDAGFSMQLDWASNKQEFKAFLQQGGYSIILADYQLPGFDAREALRWTRSLCPEVPFICVSGAIGEEKAVELLKQGATDYVLKNRLDKLSFALQRALDEVSERQTRRMMEDSLRESERFARSTVDALSAHLAILDETGTIIAINRAWRQFAQTNSVAIADVAEGANYLAVCDAAAGRASQGSAEFAAGIRAILQGAQDEFMLEYPCHSPTERRWFIGRVRRFPGSGATRLVVAHEDITERKRSEEEREKLEAHLRQVQKMEAIGTLAGGIAHDFNNILSAIVGYTELSVAKAAQGQPCEADLQQVLAAAERAKALVRQILTFSRQTKEAVEPVQIVPLLREALKFLRSSIPSTIAIQQQIKVSSDSTVLAEPTQIHQVIMNLCTNASYAMLQHGGTLEVELADLVLNENDDLSPYPGLIPGNYLCLRVSDTGTGMNEETIQRIFDPFFTTKPKEEGTGMGLSVVFGIVDACNGCISARSKPGEGSHFHVFLPRASSATLKPVSEQKEIPRGKGRILFVDDEAALARLGEKMLQGFGYTVVAETSSARALATFHTRPEHFDLLITDYTMPQMTGIELIEKIRSIRPDMPVILCSGYTDFLDGVSISDLGVRELIHKPVTRRLLAETISRVLSQ